MTLLQSVVAILDGAGIAHCLIGASALATHGHTRSTVDIDLLATDGRVLKAETWGELPEATKREFFRGDLEDTLLGTARFGAPGERPVDVVVGSQRWMADIVARARPMEVLDTPLRQPLLEDLVALKLDAGGARDFYDVRALLHDVPDLRARVEANLAALPKRLGKAWERLVQTSS